MYGTYRVQYFLKTVSQITLYQSCVPSNEILKQRHDSNIAKEQESVHGKSVCLYQLASVCVCVYT